MAPHILPRNSEQWIEIPQEEGAMGLLSRSMRKQENIPIKIAEVQTLGSSAAGGPEAGEQNSEAGKYGEAPQLIWDTLEDCEETMKNIKTPVLFVYGTEDILFHDYFDSNIKAMQIIPRAKLFCFRVNATLWKWTALNVWPAKCFSLLMKVKRIIDV